MVEIRWLVTDRYGHEIYLSEERWQHIVDSLNHPEMEAYEWELQETIRTGQRKQDALNPRKYRYSQTFAGLYGDNTHIVTIVLFRFAPAEDGSPRANNYVVTAYQKEIW